MKKLIFVCIVGFLLAFFPLKSEGKVSKDQISENISKLIDGLETLPGAGYERIKDLIQVLLDSILVVAPQFGISQELQSEIKTNSKIYKESDTVLIHEDGVKSLWKTARFMDPDFDLDLPEKATPETIKEEIRLELHQARSFHSQGKDDRVLEILLRTILRIMTPVID
jgi:hypothetical protein